MPKKNREVERVMLDARAVAHAIGISKTKLYGLVRTGGFPIGKKLTAGRVAWLASDVQRWCESRPEAIDPVRLVRKRDRTTTDAAKAEA